MTGAFAVGGVELVTTVLDTVFVSAFVSVIVATNVKKMLDEGYLTRTFTGKGFIPQYGALGHDILVFPFSYGRTIDLASSTGAEINVKLEGDIPMGGDYGTVTFYTTEDNE